MEAVTDAKKLLMANYTLKKKQRLFYLQQSHLGEA